MPIISNALLRDLSDNSPECNLLFAIVMAESGYSYSMSVATKSNESVSAFAAKTATMQVKNTKKTLPISH